MRRRAIALVVTGIAGVLPAGCGGRHARTAQVSTAASSISIPLVEYHNHLVVQALVGLTLNGHRYYFLVDTGAARTVIDARVVSKLGLRDNGSPREGESLGCKAPGQPVALRSWRLGNTSLPSRTVISQRLLIPRAFSGLPFGGLLGSDFLSSFGTVTIDFTHRQLILGGRTPTGGHTVSVTVLRRAGSVSAATQVGIDGHRVRFLVDTGAAISVIDSATAGQLRLPVVGPSARVTGAVCHSALAPVAVRGWSFAGWHLPHAVIGSAPDVLPKRYLTEGITGIIGTSSLAHFGTLTINYTHSKMILGGTSG